MIVKKFALFLAIVGIFLTVVLISEQYNLASAVHGTNYTCTKNTDCDDGNPLTFDECINPSTVVSTCRNTEINCASDNDCGFTGFIGDGFCVLNSIMRNFKEAKCRNPGTLESHCIVIINTSLFQNCDIACISGFCVRCNSSSDCDDGNNSTRDVCVNPGTINASCLNEPIRIECSKEIDCGIDQFIGEKQCVGKNVTRIFRDYICHNPGTENSSCSFSDNLQILESCNDVCLNGECVTINCFADSDCDDGNNSTRDVCVNPGTINASCLNEMINNQTLFIKILSPENKTYQNRNILLAINSNADQILFSINEENNQSYFGETLKFFKEGSNVVRAFGIKNNESVYDEVFFFVRAKEDEKLKGSKRRTKEVSNYTLPDYDFQQTQIYEYSAEENYKNISDPIYLEFKGEQKSSLIRKIAEVNKLILILSSLILTTLLLIFLVLFLKRKTY